MSSRKKGKHRGSSRTNPASQIDRFLREKLKESPEAYTVSARGGTRPSSSTGGMASPQQASSQPLTGIPALLNPSMGSQMGTSPSARSSGDDSDIRALLKALPTKADMEALPTKADMEALVMRMEEQHRRDLQEIRTEVQVIDDRLTREEASVGSLELRVTQLEKAQQRHQEQLAEVQLHAEDLENRSRRQNLRFRGIPEATGQEDLSATVSAIIHTILDGDLPASLEFDRVHRALGPRLADADRPRDVLCRLHRYSHKEQIMRAARLKGTVDFDGAQIAIFPDISRATLWRRSMLKPLLERLNRAELTYRWGFPVQLTIRKGADYFTLRRHSELPELFTFLNMEPIPLRNWLGPLPKNDPRPASQSVQGGLPRRSARRRQREPTPLGRGDLEP